MIKLCSIRKVTTDMCSSAKVEVLKPYHENPKPHPKPLSPKTLAGPRQELGNSRRAGATAAIIVMFHV